MRKCVLPAALILAACGSAFADPILDGVRDAGYTTLAVQNTQTQFAASNLGDLQWANGSALANISYQIAGGNLYLHIAGNLESNFNKLELFFDNGTGGQNVLRSDNADVDFNGLNRMGNDGSGNWSAGVGADILQRYRVDLKYSSYYGDYATNAAGAMTVANGANASLSDRGWVSLTFKTTF